MQKKLSILLLLFSCVTYVYGMELDLWSDTVSGDQTTNFYSLPLEMEQEILGHIDPQGEFNRDEVVECNHDGRVTSVCFSTGGLLASDDFGRIVKIFDVQKRTFCGVYKNDGRVSSVCFSTGE